MASGKRGPHGPLTLWRGLNRFRSTIPGEYTGYYTLLKKCPNGTVFLGTDVGTVITATILSGGDSPDDTFRKPLRAHEAATAVRAAKVSRTVVKPMFWDGANVQTALGQRYELELQAFYAPTGDECVAGWDRKLKRWVIDG